jgi:hypothetical protein
MPKADAILDKVIAATRVGKLTWELVGRDSFRSQIGRTYLSISKDEDDFTFAIYDDDGNILESVCSSLYNQAPQELYDQARRAALKIDDALEDLDQQLNRLI